MCLNSSLWRGKPAMTFEIATGLLSAGLIFAALLALGMPGSARPVPNILLVIMGDAGIDQVKALGYGGATAPAVPDIDVIARGEVRFHNAWSMPPARPSRGDL